jgi:hypothetical protein
MGDHYGNRQQRRSSRAMERGKDHRTRRLRSSPRTSGPFESVFRWRTGCGSSPVSTWASATSFAGWPGCGQVRDVCHRDQVASRAVVMQHKTQRPVQFEITPAARDAAAQWIRTAALKSDDYLFPSRIHGSPHLGTRQYARVRHPICAANKSDADLSRTRNLRAIQLLLGNSKLLLPRSASGGEDKRGDIGQELPLGLVPYSRRSLGHPRRNDS